MRRGSRKFHSNWILHGLSISFFALLTLAVTWPLAAHLKDRVPGWFIADNYEYLWKMWWFKHRLLEVGENPLFAPHIFYPVGFQLAHAELTPLHTLFGMPLTLVLGEVASYNIFTMLSFVVSGWAMFTLVFHWTNNHWAGILAGTLFTLNPYHVVRYGGILPLMSVEGIPVFFLGCERWLDSLRFRWLGLACLGFLLSSSASIYYAFSLLFLGTLFLLIRLHPFRFSLNIRKVRWGLTILGVFCMVVTVPILLPHYLLSEMLQLQIPLVETDFWSVSPTDYLLPSGIHPLWGDWVQQQLLSLPPDYPQISLEFILGVGFLGILFGLYGWRNGRVKAKGAIIGTLLAALVLSFGLRLHYGRHPVLLPAPDGIVEGFNGLMNAIGRALPTGEGYQALSAEGISIPLPALLLRWLLPPLQGMRAWNRFAVFVSLGIALLAGLGYAAWIDREVRGRFRAIRGIAPERYLGVLVLFLALFELWPRPVPLQPVQPRPVDEWLAQQPELFTIMELPLTSALSAPQMLYTRYHGKRIAFAYGTYFPYWYRSEFPELQRCPEQECLQLLRKWDVKYVLLNLSDENASPAFRRSLERSQDLQFVHQTGEILVYRLLR